MTRPPKTILRALAAVMLVAGAAAAQPMAAMKGTPLPASDLAPGTVSVRVVAGNITTPVPGVAVTLTVNGTAREARTDDEGRAFFKDLAVGAKVQAKISGEDGKDVTSEEFDVPGDNGIKLMLSTRPIQAGMGGAPFAGGGAGGMPEPRKISGTPRPEQANPPGTYTVRLTYDDLTEKEPPAGVPVTVVGYAADESVSSQTVLSDKTGHAQFTNLDRSGATAYFALAAVPRGSVVDRLMAQPVSLAPQVGAVVLLSADKRASTGPAIDDTGDEGAPAGTVRVTLEGAPDNTTEVRLIDVQTHAIVGKSGPHPGPPDPTAIQGSAPFEPKSDLPAGTLDVEVRGGQGTADAPMPHITVKLIPGDTTDAPAGAPSGETDAAGKTRVVATKPGVVRALLTINGRDIPTDTFDLTSSGGILHVQAHWPSEGPPEASFPIVPKPGEVVYAEATAQGQVYRSRPIELLEGKGAKVSVAVLPRIMFTFSWSARIDDAFLAVQGRFDVYNNSWIPYAGNDSDGILIPLPKGFKGGILANEDQTDVGVAPGEGFRIVRPLAPGVRRFVGGFSVPVEDGEVDWSLDLPLGAYQSGMEIQQVPGMSVKTPGGFSGRTFTDERGTWYVLSPITILPRQSMVMKITGMPSQPGWRTWVPRLLGVLVIVLLVGGLTIALVKARSASPQAALGGPEARRQQLLDELVALEQAGPTEGSATRKDQILGELERLWDRS